METERIKFVADMQSYQKSLDKANLNLQKQKDKIKEINQAIKELGKQSGARKDLVLIKAEEERKLKAAKQEVKELNKEMSKSAKGISMDWKSITAGIGLAGATLGKFIQLSNKEEDSQRKVNFMFKEQGKNVIALANSMQVLTGVDNQVIQDMAVMAKTMGVSNENIQKVIQGGIGLEKTLGINATSAVRYLSLAIEEGDYTMLNRYIPSMRTMQTDTEKQAELNRVLGESFELAKDRMNTTAGAFETLSNTITDESEKIGAQLNESLGMGNDSALNQMIIGLSTFFQWMIQGLRGVGTNIGIFVYNGIELFAGFSKAVVSLLAGIATTALETFKGIGTDLKNLLSFNFDEIGNGFKEGISKGFNEALGRVKKSISDIHLQDFTMEVFELKKATDEVSTALKNEAEAIKYSAQVTEEASLRQIKFNEELKVWVKRVDEVDNAYKNLIVTQPDLRTEFEKTLEAASNFHNTYKDLIDSTFQTASMYNNMELAQVEQKYSKEKQLIEEKFAKGILSEEKYNQELKKLELQKEKEQKKINERQKKIDIAMAVTNTAVAITNALRTQPFLPLGPIMAGLAAAQGAIQIATIRAQEFADGGSFDMFNNKASENLVVSNRATGAPVGLMNSREPIMTEGVAKDPALYSAASAINVAGGGRAFPGAGSVQSQPINAQLNASSSINMQELTFNVLANINNMKNNGVDTDGL